MDVQVVSVHADECQRTNLNTQHTGILRSNTNAKYKFKTNTAKRKHRIWMHNDTHKFLSNRIGMCKQMLEPTPLERLQVGPASWKPCPPVPPAPSVCAWSHQMLFEIHPCHASYTADQWICNYKFWFYVWACQLLLVVSDRALGLGLSEALVGAGM